jgi:pyruvate formate lyase activating enzyme
MTASRTDQRTAVIFDIQRVALHDGPGIRTNVFFKGCPLACAWCHNPESHAAAPQLSFNALLCRGCRLCAEACPRGVHEFRDVGGTVLHAVDHSRCDACGRCLEVCCHDALSIAGRTYSVEELLREIDVDRPYYAIGEGGGLTLTGGEPMRQCAFIAELLDRTDGIDVCLETSGHAPAEDFRALLPKIDLFLFDCKATDPIRHRELCGVDNTVILGNLDLLCRGGARVALRLPLVPSVNDDDGHLAGISALLAKYPSIEYAEIMPYHNLGVSKRERFGTAEPAVSLPSATGEQAERWRARLASMGARDLRIG